MKNKEMITHKDITANINNPTWTGNILQRLAEDVVRSAIPLEEVIKSNLSEKLLKELEREVKNNEIIKLVINAKMRLGKSTLAILLGLFIDSLLKKYKKKDENIKFGIKNIARDQNELAKRMREPDLMQDIIITDENNAQEETGENATVEKAQRDMFSDVQAGRYIHGIFVQPEGMLDKNCDIKLEIRNRERGIIHVRVSYFLRTSFYYGWVLIGVADFDVSALIKNWAKIETRFMRYLKEKREDDRKVLEYWSKRDFYVEYMIKKYEKMELMNREGIMHSRDLDYAEIINEVVMKLKPLAELEFISMQRLKNNVVAKIETEFRKRKMPLSILGKEAQYTRIMSYLEMYRSLADIKINIRGIVHKFQKEKITEYEYNKTITILKQAQDEIESEIKINEENLAKLCKLNEKYNSHLK